MKGTSADWNELFAIFERIADAPSDARAALLDAATRGHPERRARLDRLLALDASETDFVGGVSDCRANLFVDDDDDAIPQRLGPWQVMREIAVGGMGRVLLAERADGGYEQSVAVKLIRGEFATDAAIARFLVERRILARLDHPGIARLIDGGVEASGRPWFAMQFVDGPSLPDYCDRKAVGLEARVRLIIDLCEAVAYAHRQLVVHCDLKPSNVLVDADSQIRLLDFGIARMLGTDAGGFVATATQSRALTPGYAAPEQLAGKPVGVATDVYAIGVMLYEVLTGRRPYAGYDDTPATAAVAQAQQEPPPPSRVVADRMPFSGSRLHGDLDAIIGKALQHAPCDRYPDAAAFADDLRRHLSGFPLHAQRASTLHRTGKFIRRHRTAVAVTIVAAFALLFATAVALQQGAAARRQAAEATAVRDFLIGIFRNGDPRSGHGGIDTRMLIDRGSAGLDGALTSQPELAAGFAEVLGNVYAQLAAYDEAEAMLRRALELTEQRHGRDAAPTAPILRALAQVHAERGRLDEANMALDRASAIDSRTHDAASPDLIADSAVAADLAQRGGNLAKAQALIDDAIFNARRARVKETTTLAKLLNQRANIEQPRGLLDDAERDTREALDLFRRQNGDQSLDVAENLVNLGVLRMRRGDADGAEPTLREGLAVYRRLLPAEHPLIADAMTNLARALDRRGKTELAEPMYQEVLQMQRHLFGDYHADVATTLNNLAVLYVGKADFTKARATMQQVVDAWTQISGPTHPLALASRGNLGVIEREQGDYIAARVTLQSALEDYRNQPDSAARQAYCLDQLGILLRYEDRPAEALALHRKAEVVRAQIKQIGPVEHASGLVALSLAETANADPASARRHADEAIALLDNAKSQGDARYADALVARARAALAMHDIDAAAQAIGAAMALRTRLYGQGDWRSAESSLVAAEIEAANGERGSAFTKAESARSILIAQRGGANPLVREATRVLQDRRIGQP